MRAAANGAGALPVSKLKSPTSSADSSFVLVFLDDASALYVRRQGRLAPIARRFGYSWVSGGEEGRMAIGPRLMQDSTARLEMQAELERAIRSSPRHASASDVLCSLLMRGGAWESAERHLEEAHRLEPNLPGYFIRRGIIALASGRTADAVRLLETERKREETPTVDLRLASALWAANDQASAIRLLERATRRFPDHQPLSDTLSVLRGRSGRPGR